MEDTNPKDYQKNTLKQTFAHYLAVLPPERKTWQGQRWEQKMGIELGAVVGPRPVFSPQWFAGAVIQQIDFLKSSCRLIGHMVNWCSAEELDFCELFYANCLVPF